MAPPLRVEVAVAGAGPAGSIVARILALRGIEVRLIDPLTRPVDRLELIAPAARPLLRRLGVDGLLEDPAIARPCLGIQRRWGSLPEDFEDFLRHPLGEGHVVDRQRFDAALRALAVAAGAMLVKRRVVGAERGRGGIGLSLSDGVRKTCLRARTVIDASGRPALVARRLGARRLLLGPLVARRTGAGGAAPGSAYLQVDGKDGGWRYRIAGPGGRSELWQLTRAPTSGSGRRIGGAVDASSARLDMAAGAHWLAVGDAAASFDPITSQGLANAFSTAQVAAGMVLAGLDEDDSSALYADAVSLTHERSEMVRARVYSGLG